MPTINEVMSNPTIHTFTKKIIIEALEHDPVDAIADMQLALDTFKQYYDSISVPQFTSKK